MIDLETKAEAAAAVDNIPTRGERGEVGTASAGQTIKQRWHQVQKDLGTLSAGNTLKRFAKRLLKDGDPVAKDWFAHKAGGANAKRTDKNVQRVMAERTASHAAKRKKKGQA
jgi:hypothetical protein